MGKHFAEKKTKSLLKKGTEVLQNNPCTQFPKLIKEENNLKCLQTGSDKYQAQKKLKKTFWTFFSVVYASQNDHKTG